MPSTRKSVSDTALGRKTKTSTSPSSATSPRCGSQIALQFEIPLQTQLQTAEASESTAEESKTASSKMRAVADFAMRKNAIPVEVVTLRMGTPTVDITDYQYGGAEAAAEQANDGGMNWLEDYIKKEKDASMHGVKRTIDQMLEGSEETDRGSSLQPVGKKPRPNIETGKNAVAVLNERMPKLVYVTTSKGPPHMPLFTVSVDVDGQIFSGMGNSKKLAKLAVAGKVISALAIMDGQATDDVKPLESPVDKPLPVLPDEPNTIPSSSTPVQQLTPGDRNPVSLLNEVQPRLVYKVVSESGQSHAMTFVIQVCLDGVQYTGTASSKKMAKMRAARSALEARGYQFEVEPGKECVNGDGSSSSSGSKPNCRPTSSLADRVSSLILEKFAEMSSTLAEQHARRKVLAGVVMTTSSDLSTARVISIATGTKCASGQFMSLEGIVLNDCHAEILSRRGLRAFLYSKLEEYVEGAETADEAVLVRNDDTGKFEVKPNVKFHLYISTAPCGDGRIFSPRDEAAATSTHNRDDSPNGGDTGGDRHPNRIARGRLRTKIESGEGTIPVQSGGSGVQTWDGVLQGERLLTMSCSDKVARWNVVGVQGSLLSHFVEPIYLTSVIVGTMYHSEHLTRALFGRLASLVETLPDGYRVNRPLLSTISSPEVRQPTKSPNYACLWVLGDQDMEVVNSTTGVRELEGLPSKLSKQVMFRRFSGLWKDLPLGSVARGIQRQPLAFYCDAKKAAAEYQAAKVVLFQGFESGQFGKWVRRPLEMDEFAL